MSVSKDDADRTTFERVRENLIKCKIPAEQIRIKTASINELEKERLLDPDCPVRFIITVNALKEGWDCPFAYILASLAARSSAVDVEQIVGRVLRQPYVVRHQNPLLNMSYVFTASARFQETLASVVKGLNQASFSQRDYRAITEDGKETALTDKELVTGKQTSQPLNFSDHGSEADSATPDATTGW